MNNIKTSHDLKRLNTQLREAELDLQAIHIEKKALQSREDKAKSKIKYCQTEIASLKANSAEPIVSEHALLRYIERVYKIDLDSLKAEILTPEVVEIINMGATRVPTKDCRLVVKDRTVITVEMKAD